MVEFLNFVVQTLVGELLVVIVGVLIANLILARWQQYRYGRWQVIVQKDNQELVRREVSPRKAKEILEEPADLVVFLKGIVSPFDWINCDLFTEGQQVGLLCIDPEQRIYYIDLDKNPPSSSIGKHT